MDQIPTFDYDTLLWQERQIRSIANMTRQNTKDFLRIAGDRNYLGSEDLSDWIKQMKLCRRSGMRACDRLAGAPSSRGA